MKQYPKRIVALILALALCLGIAPFSVLAESTVHGHGEVVSLDDFPEEEYADPTSSYPDAGTVTSEDTLAPAGQPTTGTGLSWNTPFTPSVANRTDPDNTSPGYELDEESLDLATLLETEGASLSVTRDGAVSTMSVSGRRLAAARAPSNAGGTLYIGTNSFGSVVGYLNSVAHTINYLPTKTIQSGGSYIAAYCLDIELGATGGLGYTGNVDLATALGADKASLIGDILAQGYQYKGSSRNVPEGDKYKWAITQLMIWQAVHGTIKRENGLNVVTQTVMSEAETLASKCGHYSEYYSYLYELKAKLENMRKIPSFAKGNETDAVWSYNVLLDKGDGTFGGVFTDANKVLEYFEFAFADANISASKSGNKLSINSSVDVPAAIASQEAIRNVKGGADSAVGWSPSASGQQRFITAEPQDDPVRAFIAVTTDDSGGTPAPSDDEQQWRVHVTKTDVETGAAQGDAALSGAVYGIYKDGSLLDTYITDSIGSFTTQYYDCGTGYTLKEISASTGYLLNTSSIVVGHDVDDSGTELFDLSSGVTEQVIKGKVRITKHTDDGLTQIETPEEGAEFQVYLASAGSYDSAKGTEKDTITIDADGVATTKDLPYGIYTVHQTSGWEGKELITDFQVFVSENGKTYAFIINNKVFEALITVIKKDIETGKTIPASGIGFKILNVDTGEFVTQHINYPTPQDLNVFYTDVTGKLMLPEMLPYGHYQLIEQATAYGYVLNSDPVDFTVDGTAKEIVVVKSNVPQKGSINIYKEGEVFFHVDAAGPDGPYSPLYSLQGLPGAEFDIFAAADIYTTDGTLRYPAGEKVDTLTTNEYGRAASVPLYLGQYVVVETQAPDGCVINTTPWVVELTYAGQTVDLTASYLSVTDDRQKAVIGIMKAMERDNKFKLGTNDEYQDVTFGLFAAEDIVALDGTKIPADGLIEEATVTEFEAAAFSADVPFGKFYIKEIATNDHYILSDTKYPVEFTYMGQSQDKVYLIGNSAEWVMNELKRGKILGHKIDEDGVNLPGALMGLFFSDEISYTEDTAILTAVSDENGDFVFEDVPFGDWIVREIRQPTPFVLNETSYPVSVTTDGQEVSVEVKNIYIKGDVQLEKTDAEYTGQRLSGAVFQVWKDANDNKIYDAADILVGTLTESSRGMYAMHALRYGGYFCIETSSPAYYILDRTPRYFEIRKDGAVIKLAAANQPQRGSLYIYKKSEDAKVAGIKFTVTGKPFTGGTYKEDFETDQNGAIYISGLRLGEYTVTEVRDSSTARYEIAADQTVKVEYGQINGVEFYNQLRRNSVFVTKTDPDYPDSKLLGARFSVYVDSDFSGDFDPKIDEFYGDLEADQDIYWLDGLPEGCYFLHEELAPVGYIQDEEYYYFEIGSDSPAQVEITNTPDKDAGFVNRRLKGSLKILKRDASTGKPLAGVNFCLKNRAGEVISEGTTDGAGVLEFTDLELSGYAYQEIYALPGYTLDDTLHSFTLSAAQPTLEVVVKNEAQSILVPRTSDGRINPVVLYSLLGFGLMIAGSMIFFALHGNHKEKSIKKAGGKK